MNQLRELTKSLRSSADALDGLAEKDPTNAEARRTYASTIDTARTTLRLLTSAGLEPEDFVPQSECRQIAGRVDAGRRRLANALSIAVQSMFTAPDPAALRRDLGRAIRGLREQADAEDELIALAEQGRDVA